MKVKIYIEKNDGKSKKCFGLDIEVIDKVNVKSCDIQRLRKYIIKMICGNAYVDGWKINILSRHLNKKTLELWQVVGLKRIMQDYHTELFNLIWREWQSDMKLEKERFNNEMKDVDNNPYFTAVERRKAYAAVKRVSVTSPFWRMYCAIRDDASKQYGTVTSLCEHFSKYGVSQSTFYRWFSDPSKPNRRSDIKQEKNPGGYNTPIRGQGRFARYEINGLNHYISRFPEDYERLIPHEDLDAVVATTYVPNML